jgi:hypothetical protein
LGDVDEAFESLGEQFLSLGDFPRMDSLSSMGPFPTMGEFPHPSQLPKITESQTPPSPNEIESVDPQARPSSTHDTQDIVGDGPLSDSDPNENAEYDIVENGCNSDENAEIDIHGQSPTRNDEPVSNPQLPSTSLSNVRSEPIEIPIREPVRHGSDYILERVLVEEQN